MQSGERDGDPKAEGSEVTTVTPALGQGDVTADPKPAATVGPRWVDRNQSAAVLTTFVLTAFYVLPVYMIALVAWQTRIFQDDNVLFTWFAAFMKSSDSTLSAFHKILFPLMAALSVVVFKDRPTRAMFTLGFFIFASWFLAMVVSVIFDMPSAVAALEGLKTPIDMALTHSFFGRIQETLMMYLMMLLGISVANSGK